MDVVHKKTDGVRKAVNRIYHLLSGVYQLLFGVDRKVDVVLKASTLVSEDKTNVPNRNKQALTDQGALAFYGNDVYN